MALTATTLTALDTRLILRVGTHSTDTRLTETVRWSTINDALQDLCLERDWPWMNAVETITTAAADNDYDVPAAYLRTRSIVDTINHRELTQVSPAEIDLVTGTGAPQFYWVDGDSIILSPTPSGVFTLKHRYIRTESALASGGSAPLVPLVFTRGIVELAAKYAFLAVKDPVRAMEAEKNYLEWLQRAQGNARQSREPYKIRVRPGSAT